MHRCCFLVSSDRLLGDQRSLVLIDAGAWRGSMTPKVWRPADGEPEVGQTLIVWVDYFLNLGLGCFSYSLLWVNSEWRPHTVRLISHVRKRLALDRADTDLDSSLKTGGCRVCEIQTMAWSTALRR